MTFIPAPSGPAGHGTEPATETNAAGKRSLLQSIQNHQYLREREKRDLCQRNV